MRDKCDLGSIISAQPLPQYGSMVLQRERAMSRSERLLDLIQIMRRYRRPVSGKVLAEETGISIRTLYRDIATLQGQGAHIEGEPGLGYMLRPGFMLPPLMFSEDEIEALVLGSRWVARQPDARLSIAARDALAKIVAVLPADLRDDVDASALLVGPREPAHPDTIDLAVVRKAIRSEHKLDITYNDGGGTGTQRLVWPFALGFSNASVSSLRGASFARISGTSVPTESRHCNRQTRVIRAAARCS